MLYETTIAEAQFPALRDFPAAGSPLTLHLSTGWVVGKFVLAGLLLIYLLGWAQDFERVRRLEAEPAPSFKVITKYQAWQRIYRPPAQETIPSDDLLSLIRK